MKKKYLRCCFDNWKINFLCKVYGTINKVQLQANVVYAHVENQCLKKGEKILDWKTERIKKIQWFSIVK